MSYQQPHPGQPLPPQQQYGAPYQSNQHLSNYNSAPPQHQYPQQGYAPQQSAPPQHSYSASPQQYGGPSQPAYSSHYGAPSYPTPAPAYGQPAPYPAAAPVAAMPPAPIQAVEDNNAVPIDVGASKKPKKKKKDSDEPKLPLWKNILVWSLLIEDPNGPEGDEIIPPPCWYKMVFWLLTLGSFAVGIASLAFFIMDLISPQFSEETFSICGNPNAGMNVCGYSNTTMPTASTCTSLNANHREQIRNDPPSAVMLKVMFGLDAVGSILVAVGIFLFILAHRKRKSCWPKCARCWDCFSWKVDALTYGPVLVLTIVLCITSAVLQPWEFEITEDTQITYNGNLTVNYQSCVQDEIANCSASCCDKFINAYAIETATTKGLNSTTNRTTTYSPIKFATKTCGKLEFERIQGNLFQAVTQGLPLLLCQTAIMGLTIYTKSLERKYKWGDPDADKKEKKQMKKNKKNLKKSDN